MQPCHFFVKVPRQDVDAQRVPVAVVEQLDLSQYLVGETGRHHKAGVAGGAAQVNQPSFCQQYDGVAIRELPGIYLSLYRVPGNAGVAGQTRHIDLVVEMADVADDGVVLHPGHDARP